jgi:hypothetical protein
MNFNKEIDMSKCKEVLSVWLDETTDCDDPKWIVSRDDLNEEGKTETTYTIKCFDDYEDAVEFAKTKAHDLELSVYETENTPYAKNELILGVYHTDCENGWPTATFFADNFEDAKELAIKWSEEVEWDEDDEEVTVELKGPDGEDSFVVNLKE